MTDFKLRRGDSRTLDISALVDADGSPTTFAANDVARFSIKRNISDDDNDALVRADTGNVTDPRDGITLAAGASTGTIALTPAHWLVASLTRATHCFYDLQLSRADGSVITIAAGECDVLPDVTLAS